MSTKDDIRQHVKWLEFCIAERDDEIKALEQELEGYRLMNGEYVTLEKIDGGKISVPLGSAPVVEERGTGVIVHHSGSQFAVRGSFINVMRALNGVLD